MISSANRPRGGAMKQPHTGPVRTTLIKRIIARDHSRQAHADLIDAAGIECEAMLSELAKLGFTRQTLATLRLMPLILVAWADNRIDSQERDVIVEAARRAGVHQDTDAFVILDHWLTHRPPTEMAEAWKRYTCGVLKGFDTGPRQRLLDNMQTQMLAVANASGGWCGIRRVSLRERAVIDSLNELAKSCVHAG